MSTVTERNDDAETVDDGGGEVVTTRPIFWTTVVCTAAAVAGHGILWFAYSTGLNDRDIPAVPWQPVAGISLSIVAVSAFGGFYLASRRARVAIASSFLLTFLVMLTFVVTIDGLAGATRGDAAEIIDDFRASVALIIGFYFGSEAAVTVAKVIGVSRAGGDAAAVRRADRDLVATAFRKPAADKAVPRQD